MNIQPQLIKDCINHDRRAEYALYKEVYSYLMSICIRYTRREDAAKEALNLGFLKIINNLGRYDPAVPFKAWIRRIMINTLIDEYRREKHHHEVLEYVDDYRETANYAELNKALERMDASRIYQMIAQLPPTSREVFNLYVIDGYSHKEIAGFLGMSEGTSKWHLNAARQKLKNALETQLLQGAQIE